MERKIMTLSARHNACLELRGAVHVGAEAGASLAPETRSPKATWRGWRRRKVECDAAAPIRSRRRPYVKPDLPGHAAAVMLAALLAGCAGAIHPGERTAKLQH